MKAGRRRGMQEGGEVWREADEWVGRCWGGERAGFGGGDSGRVRGDDVGSGAGGEWVFPLL